MKTVDVLLSCDDMDGEPMSKTLRPCGLSLSRNNHVLEEQKD